MISKFANYLKYNYFWDGDGIENVTSRLWKFSYFCSRHTVGVGGDDIMFHILVDLCLLCYLTAVTTPGQVPQDAEQVKVAVPAHPTRSPALHSTVSRPQSRSKPTPDSRSSTPDQDEWFYPGSGDEVTGSQDSQIMHTQPPFKYSHWLPMSTILQIFLLSLYTRANYRAVRITLCWWSWGQWYTGSFPGSGYSDALRHLSHSEILGDTRSMDVKTPFFRISRQDHNKLLYESYKRFSMQAMVLLTQDMGESEL